MELQIVLNTFATDVFRKQADYDYVSARMNYRMQLRQQFLWSGQQAIEKYLKAILLFNGKSGRYYLKPDSEKQKQFNHDLEKLSCEVEKITHLNYALSEEDRRFLVYLNAQGVNRYLTMSSNNLPEAIHDLDRLVWNVRKYCQDISDRAIGCREEVAGMKEAVIRGINNPELIKRPTRFELFNGELERILNRKHSDLARKGLVWANVFYGKRSKHTITYSSFSSFEIPPNERNWPDVDWKVVEQYIKFD